MSQSTATTTPTPSLPTPSGKRSPPKKTNNIPIAKNSSKKATTKEKRKRHNWQWHEAVQLVQLTKELGAHNRWSVIASRLNNAKKLALSQDQVKRYWKTLLNPEKSIFFQKYKQPQLIVEPGASDAVIQQNEEIHIANGTKNKAIHKEMQQYLKDIVNSEVIIESGKHTEEQLLDSQVNYEKERSAVKHTRFEQTLKANMKEAECREAAIKLLGMNTVMGAKTKKIQTLALGFASVVKFAGFFDKTRYPQDKASEEEFEKVRDSARSLLNELLDQLTLDNNPPENPDPHSTTDVNTTNANGSVATTSIEEDDDSADENDDDEKMIEDDNEDE